MASKKILIVDDEEAIREFLSYNLRKEGYEVAEASNGVEAVEKTKSFLPDLILMDIMMPFMNGFEATRKIQALYEHKKRIIVVFLTAIDDDDSQIKGFDVGGTDYITKPIKPKVLMARIYALLKYHHQHISDEADTNIIFNDFSINTKEYGLEWPNGQKTTLPRKEFELLLLLATHPGQLFTREEIYDTIWGENTVVGDRTIDVHIRRLRQKIGGHHIETIKGVGYRFVK